MGKKDEGNGMNIFYIHSDPIQCAKWMVDRHVVKMVLETCQLLSTAHRILDGTEYQDKTKTGRNVKRWSLPDEREQHLYSATHINHPSAVWCRATNNNYNWLYVHFLALLAEYSHRYGKVHKCESMTEWLTCPPHNIPVGYKTQVTPAMPEEYIVPGDSITSYQNYYKHGKKHLHKWTNREMPEWMK
jgi:hypothetical protein